MNQLIIRSILLFFCALFLPSCVTTHSGYMSDSASLSSNNFRYVRTNAFANAECTYFLGIGGYGHDALVGEAKQNLYLKNGLKNNQAYANITVNWKTEVTFLGFIVRKVCTVSADIVEFNSGQGLSSEISKKTEPEDLSSEISNNTELEGLDSESIIVTEAPRSLGSKSYGYRSRVGTVNALAARILNIASTAEEVFNQTDEKQRKFIRLFNSYIKEYDLLSRWREFDENELLINGDKLDDYKKAHIELKRILKKK